MPTLTGAPAVLELPTDFPRPVVSAAEEPVNRSVSISTPRNGCGS